MGPGLRRGDIVGVGRSVLSPTELPNLRHGGIRRTVDAAASGGTSQIAPV
jgi:hypothetical protein